MIPYLTIKLLQFGFQHQSEGAIHTVVVVVYKIVVDEVWSSRSFLRFVGEDNIILCTKSFLLDVQAL